MADIRTFRAPGIDKKELARKVSSWLQLNDFEAQIVDLPDGRTTVQARQPKSWRYILGMSSALNITFDKKGDQMVVETDVGSWAEKFVVGAVGIFVLHPLLITMAYGVWKQSQLPDKVFGVVEQYIKENTKETQGTAGPTRVTIMSAEETSTDMASDTTPGSSAQELSTTGSAGSDASGTISTGAAPMGAIAIEATAAEQTSPSTFQDRICASCGQANSKEARYCDQCGSRL